MKNFEAYNGTDLKLVFKSEGDFSYDAHDWEMKFYVGDKVVTFTKTHDYEHGGYILTCDAENMGCLALGDGRWVFLLDTTFFGAGRLHATLTAHIPDAEFATLDRMREEVRKFNLMSILL